MLKVFLFPIYNGTSIQVIIIKVVYDMGELSIVKKGILFFLLLLYGL